MRNNDSKEPALRFDSYKFLFHRARLATFATQSALLSHGPMSALRPLLRVIRTSSRDRRMTECDPERSSARVGQCTAAPLFQNNSGLPQGPADPVPGRLGDAANRLRHGGRRLV